LYFFFQAEDGIRDDLVTGVQTCALPILRLVAKGDELGWDSRGHFFAAAAEAMRRILVENARRKASVKRGGGQQRVPFDQALPVEIGRASCRARVAVLVVGGCVKVGQREQ